MKLGPGEIYWEDRDGYTYYLVGLADGGVAGFWDKDHADAIAEVEKRKAA